MPLVLSAINFKLSSSEPEMLARRQPLQRLSEVMSHSRRVYNVGDFISSQTDFILYLAYLTSREVFSHRNPESSSGTQHSHNSMFAGTSKSRSENQMAKGPAKHWRDAFLRYPRAYLLISTTVDYFMSVGRLPQDSSLPDLVRSLPPMGRIRLPWALNGPFLDSGMKRKQGEQDYEEQSRPLVWSLPGNAWGPENGIRLSEDSSTSHLDSPDTLNCYIDSSAHENQVLAQNDQLNLDYLPMSPLLNIKARLSSSLATAGELSQAVSATVKPTEGQPDHLDLTDVATPYCGFMSTLVQDYM